MSVLQMVPERYLARLFTLIKKKYGMMLELNKEGEIISAPQDPDGVVIADISQVLCLDHYQRKHLI